MDDVVADLPRGAPPKGTSAEDAKDGAPIVDVEAMLYEAQHAGTCSEESCVGVVATEWVGIARSFLRVFGDSPTASRRCALDALAVQCVGPQRVRYVLGCFMSHARDAQDKDDDFGNAEGRNRQIV